MLPDNNIDIFQSLSVSNNANIKVLPKDHTTAGMRLKMLHSVAATAGHA